MSTGTIKFLVKKKKKKITGLSNSFFSRNMQPLMDIKGTENFNHLSIQSQLGKSYLRDLHKYKPSKTFHLQRGFQDPISFVL